MVTVDRLGPEIMDEATWELTLDRIQLLVESGQFDAAINLYKELLDIEPDTADLWINLGVTYRAAGRFDEAVSCYKTAMELEPDAGDINYMMANVLRSKEDYKGAVRQYRLALSKSYDELDASNNLALCLVDRDRLDSARNIFTCLAERYPNDADVRRNLGWVAERSANYNEAVVRYEQAVLLDASYLAAWESLVAVYEIVGDMAGAERASLRVQSLEAWDGWHSPT